MSGESKDTFLIDGGSLRQLSGQSCGGSTRRMTMSEGQAAVAPERGSQLLTG